MTHVVVVLAVQVECHPHCRGNHNVRCLPVHNALDRNCLGLLPSDPLDESLVRCPLLEQCFRSSLVVEHFALAIRQFLRGHVQRAILSVSRDPVDFSLRRSRLRGDVLVQESRLAVAVIDVINGLNAGSVGVHLDFALDQLVLRADHVLDVQQHRSQVCHFFLGQITDMLLGKPCDLLLNESVRNEVFAHRRLVRIIPCLQRFQFFDGPSKDSFGHKIQVTNVLVKQCPGHSRQLLIVQPFCDVQQSGPGLAVDLPVPPVLGHLLIMCFQAGHLLVTVLSYLPERILRLHLLISKLLLHPVSVGRVRLADLFSDDPGQDLVRGPFDGVGHLITVQVLVDRPVGLDDFQDPVQLVGLGDNVLRQQPFAKRRLQVVVDLVHRLALVLVGGHIDGPEQALPEIVPAIRRKLFPYARCHIDVVSLQQRPKIFVEILSAFGIQHLRLAKDIMSNGIGLHPGFFVDILVLAVQQVLAQGLHLLGNILADRIAN